MTDNLGVFFIAGLLFGSIYDILRFFRLVFPGKRAAFVFDLLFFIIISPAMFLLLLSYNNGQVRVFYFTAVIIGFLLYVLTLYRLTGFFERGLAAFLRFIIKNCLKSFKKVLQIIKKLYYNIFALSKRALHLKKKSKKKVGETDGEAFAEFETE